MNRFNSFQDNFVNFYDCLNQQSTRHKTPVNNFVFGKIPRIANLMDRNSQNVKTSLFGQKNNSYFL